MNDEEFERSTQETHQVVLHTVDEMLAITDKYVSNATERLQIKNEVIKLRRWW
jgi:hypothetical protein